MKFIKYALFVISTTYIGISLAEDLAKPFNPISSGSTSWIKSGTGTTYKMTRVDDMEKKVSCYVLDSGSNPILSCVKE